ncbi:MAG: hypothetical protein WA996_21030 [Candidatus Promineifilaceae bacterium]
MTYLQSWLDDQANLLDPMVLIRLRQEANSKLQQLRKGLRLDELVASAAPLSETVAAETAADHREDLRPVEKIAAEIALVRSVITYLSKWEQYPYLSLPTFVSYKDYMLDRDSKLQSDLNARNWKEDPGDKREPTELEAVGFAIRVIPMWAEKNKISHSSALLVKRGLDKRSAAIRLSGRTPAPVTHPIATKKRIRVAKPKETPKPKEPLFDWAKIRRGVIDAAASGALLRGLLYLGAFMIVVSVAVLVINFWELIPTAVRIGFIAAVPAAFYLAGWLIRSKLKLPQAGSVLTGIGMLLVAVDLTAVFRFAGLADSVDPYPYWFGASLFCTALYAVTAWRVPLEAFGYITLLALTSTLISFGYLMNFDVGFIVAMIPLFSLIMLGVSRSLRRVPEQWAPLAKAALRLPSIMIPLSQVLVIFAPGDFGWSQALTYALASVDYALLALLFPMPGVFRTAFSHAATWSSAAAAGFAMIGVELRLVWAATATAIVASIYVVLGRLAELRGAWEETIRRKYLWALYITGFGLLGIAMLGGLLTLAFDVWAGVVALTVVSLLLAGFSYLFRQHFFLLGATGLFVLPFSVAIAEWLNSREVSHRLAWLLVGWAGLALVYVAFAIVMRKADRYVFWLYVLAHALAPLTVLGVTSDYVFSPDLWYALPAVISLGGVLLVYLASALILDSGRHPALIYMVRWLPPPFNRSVFLWPVAVVAPLWIVAAWTGGSLEMAWLGVIFSSLALAYVIIGQALIRRDHSYRLPFHTGAYILPLIGIAIALDDNWALLTALLISVSVLISLSYVYRRVWEVAGASLLLIWPFQLALEMSALTTHSYSLAYALLATVVYIPIAMALASKRPRDSRQYDPEHRPSWKENPQAMAVYTTGYWLAAYAVASSILGRFAIYTLDVSWIGVVVPLIVGCLAIFSVYRLRQILFAWAAIVLLAIAYWQTLTLLSIPSDYHAVAWITFAIALMLLERLGIHQLDRGWWSDFSWPLGVGAAALCAIGLVLTAYPTYQAFSTDESVNYLPIIIAQFLAALMSILAARMYRSRLPLFLEPYLAFFPVTLFFLAYGERIVGISLETAHFSFVWLGLSVVQLVAAMLVDPVRIRYSHALYLGGYSISLLALGWSTLDWETHIYALGGIILVAIASQLIVHYNRHLSWDEFVRLMWRKPGSIGWRVARSTFLFIAVYAFPIWLVQLLAYNEVSLAWRGAACALVAPLLIALGLWLRRFKTEYTWPLYSAGYALTAIGAMVAYNDQRLFIAVLTLNAVVYAVSSYIFGQAFWLYVTNTLVPVIVLLTLDYNDALTTQWIAGIFMGLAFIYVAIGWWLDRRMAETGISPFALPFYILGYLLSSVALAVGSDERMLAIGIFSSAVVLYGASAWLFRETVFLYPAAWLVAVPYFLVMTLTELPSEWWGVGLLPLIVVYIMVGRFVFHKTPFAVKDWPGVLQSLSRPEMPFYLLAYAASVAMVVLSNFLITYSDQEGLIITQRHDLLPLTMSLTAGSIIYYGSGALFRRSAWLYPGLLTSHLAILTYLAITPSGSPLSYTSLPFVAVTWIVALLGLAFERRSPEVQYEIMPRFELKIRGIEIILGGWSFAGRLITRTWSQPFYVFAAIDAVLWQLVALGGNDTTIVVAVALALLTGLLAVLWQDGSLAYVSLIYLIIAIGARLDSAGLTLAQGMACMTAIGFALYFIAELTELRERLASRLSIWRRPMERTAVVITLIAVLGTLPTAASQTLATAVAMGFTGALYLAIAYRGRRYSLGYVAMAMLQIAWVLLLLDRDVNQPQFYAIPAGLYFVIIGELERRRGRNAFANYLSAFGLAVIFLTSFIQSLDTDTGLPYFVLLLIESLLAVGYGVFMQEKVPFFAGLSAAFLNVIGQLILLTTVSDVLRWIVILGTGLLLVSLAILVERRREEIATQIGEWRTALSTWR